MVYFYNVICIDWNILLMFDFLNFVVKIKIFEEGWILFLIIFLIKY